MGSNIPPGMSEDTPTQREADLRLVRIEETLSEHHETNGRIIAALEGPQIERIDGSVYRAREQGLLFQTQANGSAIRGVQKTLSNGVRTKPPRTLSIAVIGASATIIAAFGPDIWHRFVG